jgi:hypothetical protein
MTSATTLLDPMKRSETKATDIYFNAKLMKNNLKTTMEDSTI